MVLGEPGTGWRTQRSCAGAFRATDTAPALVLAAGASRRFGGAKALAQWRGQLLLDHAIGQARQLSPDVRVITGCRGPLLPLRAQRHPTSWLFTPQWRQGMSASLKLGIHTLPPRARGVFVVLVDQPLIDSESLCRLRDAARQEPELPFAADYHGRPGVPAYLPRWLWPALMTLEGDRGAGQILKAAGAHRLAIDGVAADVDTPEDLANLRRSM
ncbi:NTP transferase domain-containing protein [Marinobacter lacisalsi]|uniref:NTP transferase domain-containing protein n=1 Tax=Marinobacter lacisalsi TaxID=475979 RepID=A0ABV8QIZ5_9GAMM